MRKYNVRVFYNASCLKCGIVEKEMVITGALHFCNTCFPTEFKSDHPSKLEKENYKKWLNIQYEQINGNDVYERRTEKNGRGRSS